MGLGRVTLYLGGATVLGASVYGVKKYAELATGVDTLDRFAIRFNALLWSLLLGLDPKVVMGIINQETRGDPANYVGDTGSAHGPSIGPMQVSRDTAKALGLWTPPPGVDEREAYQALAQDMDEGTLIHWGCAVLSDKLRASGGDESLAVRLYNGAGAAAELYRQSVLSFISSTWEGTT